MSSNVLDNVDMVVVGQNLREARVLRGLKQQEAADYIGVARTTMIAIEQGQRRIKASELIKLAELYGRPTRELVRPEPEYKDVLVQFRGPHGINESDADSEKIEASITHLKILSQHYIDLEVITDSTSFKKYPAEYQIDHLKANRAGEMVAISERQRLGLGDGPIPILRDILEQNVGLRIFYFPLRPSEYSEIYFYNDVLGGCIAINSSHPEVRRRWSLAHAYGHFLMHRYKPSALKNAQQVPHSERLADSFAMHFLLPTSSITKQFYNTLGDREKLSQADLFTLANFYGVSLQALMLRLEGMKLIPSGATQQLLRRGIRVEEAQQELGLAPLPMQDQMLPMRYQYMAVQAFEEGNLSEGELAEYLEVERVHARRIAEVLRGEPYANDSTAETIES